MSGGTTGSTSKRKTKLRTKRTKEPRTDWQRLRTMTDAEVRAGIASDPDVRPTDEAFWKRAQVIMPSRKKVVTMRLDADLLKWFRRERGYQTQINAILRTYMRAHRSESTQSVIRTVVPPIHMSTDKSLREDEIAWLHSYSGEVSSAFRARFESAADRFKAFQTLVDRFRAAVDDVLANGRSMFHAVDEAHNELCIAAALLDNRDPKFTCLEYEPAIPGCTQSIDFRAKSDDRFTVFVDVKTIKPVARDRWDQFERARKEGWLPENVNVLLSRDWLGGELWHSMFAARSRMLEYSIELERKISDGNLPADNTLFILALCGEGFHWHESELEDFVAYYFSGSHRPDDPFRQAEARYVEENRISFTRSISRFACMRRPQGDVSYKRLNWNVQPPKEPVFA